MYFKEKFMRLFRHIQGECMATTKIWSIKGRIDKVIDYAENPEKTTEQFSKEDMQCFRIHCHR